MSIKENKALVLRFYDLLNKGEIDTAYELAAPEFVLHSPVGDKTREQVKQSDKANSIAFPGSHCLVSNMVAEEEKVAFQVDWQGVHKGVLMGITPTDKSYKMRNTHIVKIKNNKIVEWWGTTEIPRLMQQLGVKQ